MSIRTCTAVLITVIQLGICDDRYGDLKQNEAMCARFGMNAHFDPELVIKTKWRIYYTWNLRLSFGCLDMTFKTVNPLIINRFYSDMNKHLETQPVWEAATLLVTMGYFNHQMLLFAEPGPAGKFIGIPNISQRAIEMLPHQASVPLLKFQLKLIRDGKFLIMMDCHIGAVSLSARYSGTPPTEEELAEAVAEAGLGEGFSACMKGKKPIKL
ncbi:uncharacterized protein LOC133528932 [Cydia pomonella]|uniref:uncharacterized protein LOC133528932 n=1 Tax=Cydia pomonella TaxID=82600 RepID=UPI002ADE5454|nr:uncharacterized protein LOC133528932 [Cydia pomonella]